MSRRLRHSDCQMLQLVQGANQNPSTCGFAMLAKVLGGIWGIQTNKLHRPNLSPLFGPFTPSRCKQKKKSRLARKKRRSSQHARLLLRGDHLLQAVVVAALGAGHLLPLGGQDLAPERRRRHILNCIPFLGLEGKLKTRTNRHFRFGDLETCRSALQKLKGKACT